MNQPLTKLEAIEAKIDTKTTAITSLSSDGGGLSFQNVTEAMEFAKLMAISDIAVRKHLRGNPGACLGVVIQAVEWRMSPYAVANKSYQVNDQLGYESQLIQAVILQRAPIKGRIKYTFEGEGDDRVCIATAITLDGETVEYKSPKLSKITPKNSPLWKNDPDQQQSYFSGRSLCRRYFPDVLLGVYDRDELEGAEGMRDVTPQGGTGLAARLQGGGGGFSAEGVQEALGEATDSADQDDVADDQVSEETAPVVSSEATKPVSTTPDPEIIRDGGSAARDGQERTPPEGLDGFQRKVWFDAYDNASEAMEAEAGVSA